MRQYGEMQKKQEGDRWFHVIYIINCPALLCLTWILCIQSIMFCFPLHRCGFSPLIRPEVPWKQIPWLLVSSFPSPFVLPFYCTNSYLHSSDILWVSTVSVTLLDTGYTEENKIKSLPPCSFTECGCGRWGRAKIKQVNKQIWKLELEKYEKTLMYKGLD